MIVNRSTAGARAAATGAGILLVGASIFQACLAFGAPWGAHAYGGRVASAGGVLPANYRVASVAAGLLLLVMASLLLARAGVIDRRRIPPKLLTRAMWAIVALLAVNTLGNATSTSAIERWALGSVTALTTLLAIAVARSPLPTRSDNI